MIIFRPLFAALLALGLLAFPAQAHEGHRQDLSDEEMARMDMGEGSAHVMDEAMDTAHEDGNSSQAEPPLTPEQALDARIAENRASSAGDVLGRLHPVAAHFPIALLLVAAITEIVLVFRPAAGLRPMVNFLVAGGAIGAGIAAMLGWFAGGWRLTDRSDTLFLHRWNGTAIAVLAALAYWLSSDGRRRAPLRIVLFVIAAALLVQGYLGGEMVFGPNHLGLQ